MTTSKMKESISATSTKDSTTNDSSEMEMSASQTLDRLQRLNQGYYGEETLSPDSSFNTCSTWLLHHVQQSYEERLKTFSTPSTYYAKPLELSPLVCARFGYKNSKQDFIQCTHPGCKAIVCVKFHPDLSSSSRRSLARTYRATLAKAHSSDCPFKNDSERWLLHNETETNDALEAKPSDQEGDNKIEPSFVPPYLQSMSNEFKMFDDITPNGRIVKNLILEEAHKLSSMMSFLESKNKAALRWHTPMPQKVLHSILDTSGVSCVEMAIRKREFEMRACDKIMKSLESMKIGNDDSTSTSGDVGDKSSTPEKKVNQVVLREEAAMLAAFGWRQKKWSTPQSLSVRKELEVVCPLCHTCAKVSFELKQPLVEDDSDERPSKKQRTVKCYFDLVNSHRHFCPYSGGFAPEHPQPSENEKDVEVKTKPGWVNVIRALIKIK